LLRVSDQRQAGADKFSVDAQRRVLRERCRREGLVIVREYVGEGESAFTSDVRKRKTIIDMSADAAVRVFKNLAVHDLSRYARDEELGHAVFNMLERHGIRLINASSDVDYTTPEGRMMLSIDLGLGSYWSRKMSFHIKKSKRERFELGLHVGDVSFGYKPGPTNRDPNVVVPVEAEAIAHGFRDRVAGAGFVEIGRLWNAAGLRPHSKQGNLTFTASAVQSVLENDYYCGYVRHKGECRRGIHEPIISEELFAAAQAVTRRQAPRSADLRLLTGLLECAACGGPIWQCRSGPGQSYVYYREASQRQNRGCPIAGAMWACGDAEAQVDAVVEAMVVESGWLARIDREARIITSDTSSERRKLETKRRKIHDAYFEQEILTKEEFKKRGGEVDAALAQLGPERPQEIVFAKERLVSIGQVWTGMNIAERREACRILFQRVRMNTREKKLWIDPWPEFTPLFELRRELCVHGTPGRTRTCAHGLGNHCSIL
jgi:Resolvase, N terminal domain/Recombinase